MSNNDFAKAMNYLLSIDDDDGDRLSCCNSVGFKKLFGTTARVHELVDTHTKEYLNAQKEKEKQARREANAAAEKKAYERRLKAEIKKQMLILDAQIQIINGAKTLVDDKEN